MKNNILTFDRDSCMILLDILNIEKKCSNCGIKITKDNFGGCFGQEELVSCNNLFCLNEILGKLE